MEKMIKFELPEGKTGKILDLPDGRPVSFPFLQNCRADAIYMNNDAVIESFLFYSPQTIELENIICPKRLGCLSGRILTKEIAVSEEEQCFLINLIEPIQLDTNLLGVINLIALRVDTSCNLTGFIRYQE